MRISPHKSWLLHVDRQAMPVAFPGAAVSEVGEHLWLISTAEPLTASGLVRFAMPVEVQAPATALRDSVPVEVAAALAPLIAAARGHAIFPLRRHARFAVATLAQWIDLPPASGSLDTPTLYIAVGDESLFAGVIAPRATGSPWVAGRPPAEAADADAHGPSRARAKLVEALAWAEHLGHGPPPGGLWLEVGAFPGGMTTELAARGYRVLAVDLNPPSDAMRALPGVTCIHGDATSYAPPEPLDALLSDVNGPPGIAQAAAVRLAAALKPGGLVVHTLKLPRWEDCHAASAKLTTAFAAAGVEPLGLRHLYFNRQELTYLGMKRPLL